MIFARKMSEFYIIIARKLYFPNFRGARALHAPSPTPKFLFSKLLQVRLDPQGTTSGFFFTKLRGQSISTTNSVKALNLTEGNN